MHASNTGAPGKAGLRVGRVHRRYKRARDHVRLQGTPSGARADRRRVLDRRHRTGRMRAACPRRLIEPEVGARVCLRRKRAWRTAPTPRRPALRGPRYPIRANASHRAMPAFPGAGFRCMPASQRAPGKAGLRHARDHRHCNRRPSAAKSPTVHGIPPHAVPITASLRARRGNPVPALRNGVQRAERSPPAPAPHADRLVAEGSQPALPRLVPLPRTQVHSTPDFRITPGRTR
jgi:hypothetical protein